MTRVTPEEVEIRMVFASRLEMAMVKKNISTGKLGKMAGVPKSTLSKYLRAETTAQIHVLSKVGNALNVTTDYLLGRSEKQIDELSPIAKKCAEKIETMSKNTQEYFLLVAISVENHIESLKEKGNFSPSFITNL